MIFPFIVIYFIKTGHSFFQISLINFAFGFSMFLFEIPTGAFADGFSRKYSVALGFLIVAISVSLIPITTNFNLIVLWWAFAGIGLTFVSGAQESWIIDNLNKAGRADLHQEYFIKGSSFMAFGSIFAPLIGATIVKGYSITILWFVFGFGFLVNAILTLLCTKEHNMPTKIKPVEILKNSVRNTKMGLTFSVRHKVIFISFLAGLFTQFMLMGNDGRQPFLVGLGMKEYQLGYLYSISSGVSIFLTFLSRRFTKYKPKNVLSVVILIRAVFLLTLFFVYPPFFYIASFLFIMIDGMFKFVSPINLTYLHKFIPERIRATTMSVKNMVDQFVISLTSLAAGGLLDLFGPQKVIAFGGFFGIIAIILYQKIKD
jgi:MFS family permease